MPRHLNDRDKTQVGITGDNPVSAYGWDGEGQISQADLRTMQRTPNEGGRI